MPLILFLSGALMCGYIVIALFFLRFWQQTRDRLFGFFAAAFFLLALQRLMVAFLPPSDALYIVRLGAFALILIAIADKNRRQ